MNEAATIPAAAPPAAVRRERPMPQVRVETSGLWEICRNHVSMFGYKTTHPWEAILADNYFLTVQNWFQEHAHGKRFWSPDEIQIYRKIVVGPPGAESHYYEKATVVVSYADNERVTVMPLTPVMVIGANVAPSFPPFDEASEAALDAKAESEGAVRRRPQTK